MRCLIRTCLWNEQRAQWGYELMAELPNAELVFDTNHDGWATMLRALEAQGTEDCWHFEEDVILTGDWESKALVQRLFAPHSMIQGFDGFTWPHPKGPAYSTNQSFMGGQCFFVPGDYAPSILTYAQDWEPADQPYLRRLGHRNIKHRDKWKATHPEHAITCWLEYVGVPYWIAVPALVQHRLSPSLLDRGQDLDCRLSPTFVL